VAFGYLSQRPEMWRCPAPEIPISQLEPGLLWIASFLLRPTNQEAVQLGIPRSRRTIWTIEQS
jgi:hypothetical protein